jgi:hypothetical protein
LAIILLIPDIQLQSPNITLPTNNNLTLANDLSSNVLTSGNGAYINPESMVHVMDSVLSEKD